jgi:pSer/pThr/pTyr-binding forkhead associated (FHA) protein
MQVVLAMFRSDGDRRSFSLHKDMTVIGRREDCDLRIPLGEISRKHCRLIKDGEVLRVEDLGSSNGTYVNGQRVQEAEINPGDTVQVGSIAFVVQIDGTPGDDELQPVMAQHAEQSVEDSGAAEAAGDSSGGTDHTSSNGDGEAEAEPAISADGDDFDPMAILQAGDSQLPKDDMDIDIEESSHGSQAI